MTTARPTLGAFVLLGGIVCVALMDAVAKILSADVPVVEITWARFFFHGILMTPFVLMSAADRKAIFIRQSPKAWGLHLLRGLLLSVASLCFFIAIKQNPVPDSLAVFFICPLIVIVIARIFLGEAFSRRLFIAAGCGLIGVLIVLRPGGDTGYHWTIIFALGTAICFSGYIVLARFASLNKTPVMVTSWLTAVFALLPTLPFMAAALTTSGVRLWLMMITIGLLSALGHTLIIYSCRHLTASSVAILQYAEVGVAAIISWFVFSHFPDEWVWLGVIIIACANIYALRKKRG
ncbi:MAG: DMT family transporter [Candidatus Zeuxoniibacter abyssi]|nr:MAG: DMT family transporter [Candidatus Persebacteraceae bacterium AB1(2)]